MIAAVRPARSQSLLFIVSAIALTTCSGPTPPTSHFAGAPLLPSWSAYSDASAEALAQQFYVSPGHYRACLRGDCKVGNRDWGDDSMTYALHMRWKARPDPALVPIFAALTASMPDYAACDACSWSDVPTWDAVAALREHEVTGDPIALTRATAALDYVDRTSQFSGGACASLHYQLIDHGSGGLKTLETDSNYVKAKLLAYAATHDGKLLDRAKAIYQAIRVSFFDTTYSLYTTYVFDDGRTCTQLPRRFFASVNGNMISNGLMLADATGDATYRTDALHTAQAVDHWLGDGNGVFANLQAENDVAEPMIEAMAQIAAAPDGAFARDWLTRNARAAVGARRVDGTFGRFFDGPPPQSFATEWQTNGAFALMFAADALGLDAPLAGANDWSNAVLQSTDLSGFPIEISVSGRGVALVGTLGEPCCEPGHATVFIDGAETADATGIWQGKSSTGLSIDDTPLFVWKWPTPGHHVLLLQPGTYNPKEGDARIHIRGYYVLP